MFRFVVALALAIACAAPSHAQSVGYSDGLAARTGYESWFNSLASGEQIGAAYWARQRSLPHPGLCGATDAPADVGCREAQRWLAPVDARRRSEPEYRQGWNAYQPSTTADTKQPVPQVVQQLKQTAPVAERADNIAHKETTYVDQALDLIKLYYAARMAEDCHFRAQVWVQSIADSVFKTTHALANVDGITPEREVEIVDAIGNEQRQLQPEATSSACNEFRISNEIARLDKFQATQSAAVQSPPAPEQPGSPPVPDVLAPHPQTFCIARDAWTCKGERWIEEVERLDRERAAVNSSGRALQQVARDAECRSYPWLPGTGNDIVQNRISVMYVEKKWVYFCQKLTENNPTMADLEASVGFGCSWALVSEPV